MGENERKTKTSLESFHSNLLPPPPPPPPPHQKLIDSLFTQSLGLVFEAIPPLYNYQITITMSNLEWQNGKKTKSTKSQQKPEKFAVQEDFTRVAKIFTTLRNFRNAGNFHKVAKISQHCEISQTLRNSQFAKFRKMARIFVGVEKFSQPLRK